MKKLSKKILISTGGTGGHVFPAYSLAQYFLKQNIQIEIITDKRGLKYLKDSGIDLKVVNTGTIFQKNLIKIILSFFQIIFAFFSSIFIILKAKPRIVFGMGGYSSFPVCIAAKFLKIPYIIYENNLLIGKANKFLLPFAEKFFVAYSKLEGVNKKHKYKTVEIGNLIREEILNFENPMTTSEKNTLSILILGGSQAARSFGEKIPNIIKKCSNEKIRLKIFQQCLENQNKIVEEIYKQLNIEYELFNFSKNLPSYFSKIDLAITRAGSSMLAELLNCRVPMISIPFPYAAENHQLKNAKYFEKEGFSFLVEESEIDYKLFPLIKRIHKDKNILSIMKKKQSYHSDKMVFQKINYEIKKIINE